MKKRIIVIGGLAFAIALFAPGQSYAANQSFVAGDQYKYVKFGNYAENSSSPYRNAMKWIILDPQHTNAGTDGALLFLQDYGGVRAANIYWGASNLWENSYAQMWWAAVYSGDTANNYDKLYSDVRINTPVPTYIFNDWQRDMIIGVKTNEMETAADASKQYTDPEYNKMLGSYKVYASDIDGTRDDDPSTPVDESTLDKVFLLSAKEYYTYANVGTYGITGHTNAGRTFDPKDTFWLRSPVSRVSSLVAPWDSTLPWNEMSIVAGSDGGETSSSDIGFIAFDYTYDMSNNDMYFSYLANSALNLDLDKVNIIEGEGSWDNPYILGPVQTKGDQTPPDVTPVKASGETVSDGSIIDVDDTMEYSTDGVNWTPVPSGATSISDLLPGDYLVRYAETDELNASEPTTVTVGYKRSQDPPTGLEPEDATTPTTHDGKVTGADETMEYSTDGGQTWHGVTGNEIDDLAPGDVLIRYKGTDDLHPSDPVTVTVGAGEEPRPTENTPATPQTEDSILTYVLILLVGLGGLIGRSIINKK